MNSASAVPDLEGVHNFRELAPYPLANGGHIRNRMIFRSGALELMTPADRDWLAGIGKLATILDLRHDDEVDGLQAHTLNELVVQLSIFPAGTRQDALIAELNGLYGPGPTPERYLHYLSIGGSRFVEAFQLLAKEESYPVLIHCTAGKDRTGVVVGMLMDMLGANDADIADEYGLSDASIGRLVAYLESIGRKLQGTPEEIHQRLSTPPDRMAGFIKLLRERYGSAEQYLLGQGLAAEDVDSIRRLLVA